MKEAFWHVTQEPAGLLLQAGKTGEPWRIQKFSQTSLKFNSLLVALTVTWLRSDLQTASRVLLGTEPGGGLETCTAARNCWGCFLLKDKVYNEKINKP